jgi:hypothetical protein
MTDIHPAILFAAAILAYVIVAGFVCGILDAFWPSDGHERPPNQVVASVWPLSILFLLLFAAGYGLYLVALIPYHAAIAMFSESPPRDMPTQKELEGLKEPTL